MNGTPATIVLVEDEPSVLSIMTRVLARSGYEVMAFESPLKALAFLRNASSPSLLLTDVVMPEGVSGRDLAEKLHVEKPGLKIIFTSGYPKDVIGKDFVLREGVNFLQKPYYPQKLAETIRDCLDSGNLIQGDL